mmetsp:Transcript_18404/g.53068  ORF Transcript_18404/g.53068 Transcript_18404/m.53068 type:complete len:267 (-) Transcript_18404:32-832(-)|eukprot:CAMPEP_0113563830 /NCGR_PEP_ID=MMETSP0015_2-20120614/21281_1 /TAXON_ID=2838 /ORGANISM="Odontella" /LENGTH=266 /DNA_ID=CAMNT_0000465843 /DNA_START=84 /DNA_END=884 /DNA_ORIENTATION=- /assembly_acc=CAM_ASM_000160
MADDDGAREAKAKAKEATMIRYHYQSVEELFDEYADTFDDHLRNGLRYDVPNLLKKEVDAALFAEAKVEAPDSVDSGVSNKGDTSNADEDKNIPADKTVPRKFNRCLDLGCGTGLAGEVFRDRCTYLEGNDISKAMVDKAKARGVYNKAVHDNLMHHLKRKKGQSFDLVISADVVMYVYNLAAMFKELCRVVETGGVLAFSTEALEDGSECDIVRLKTERFAHSRKYVLALAKENSFELARVTNHLCRMDEGKEIRGDIFVFTKRR